MDIFAKENNLVIESVTLTKLEGNDIFRFGGTNTYNTFGNPIIEYYDYYLPDFFNTDFWFITLFIILGIFIVSLLEKYGSKSSGSVLGDILGKALDEDKDSKEE